MNPFLMNRTSLIGIGYSTHRLNMRSKPRSSLQPATFTNYLTPRTQPRLSWRPFIYPWPHFYIHPVYSSMPLTYILLDSLDLGLISFSALNFGCFLTSQSGQYSNYDRQKCTPELALILRHPYLPFIHQNTFPFHMEWHYFCNPKTCGPFWLDYHCRIILLWYRKFFKPLFSPNGCWVNPTMDSASVVLWAT